MRDHLRFFTMLAIVALFSATGAAQERGRLYGTITTVDGERFTGLIRWDKNEAHWFDILNGDKKVPARYVRRWRKAEKRHADRNDPFVIRLFGFTLFDNHRRTTSWDGTAQSGIRFGYIEEMQITGRNRVQLRLKSGQDIELENGSTDIGTDIREILIEDKDRGLVELDWNDLDNIRFSPAPTGFGSQSGDRLFGTLSTRRGEEFTGFVCWDMDEIFSEDMLDGKDGRKKLKIPFGEIRRIERYSASASRVLLKNGEELILRGSNDVDDDNRGILILDPFFGQVRFEWDDFQRLEFSRPETIPTYDDFKAPKKLRGTVTTEDGDSFTGTIHWDSDEEFTWEFLDGSHRDHAFDIEFSAIRSIEKISFRRALVTLWDGRHFELEDSNDVDEGNKGIYITHENGDEVVVYWDDFDRVQFRR